MAMDYNKHVRIKRGDAAWYSLSAVVLYYESAFNQQ